MCDVVFVIRTEKKYLLFAETAGKIEARLSWILQPDSNCLGGRPYPVTSLYFDSMSDSDFFEKCSGLETRKKIRLRTYQDGVIKLECKYKQGAKQYKQSLLLSRQEAEDLIAGHFRTLWRHESAFSRQMYVLMTEGVYRPKSLIRYQRFAYTLPTNDIRITFDRHLEAHEGNFDIFDPAIPYYPVQFPAVTVLEVKYNGFLLDYVQSALAPFALTEISNSKYVRGRKFGLGVNTR